MAHFFFSGGTQRCFLHLVILMEAGGISREAAYIGLNVLQYFQCVSKHVFQRMCFKQSVSKCFKQCIAKDMFLLSMYPLSEWTLETHDNIKKHKHLERRIGYYSLLRRTGYNHCRGGQVILISAEDRLYSLLRRIGYIHCCVTLWSQSISRASLIFACSRRSSSLSTASLRCGRMNQSSRFVDRQRGCLPWVHEP